MGSAGGATVAPGLGEAFGLLLCDADELRVAPEGALTVAAVDEADEIEDLREVVGTLREDDAWT